MAATWPATLPALSFSVGYSGQKLFSTVRTPYEAGYVGTRARFTRDRMTFRCGWAGLAETDLGTFLAFYDTCGGGGDTFSWDDESGPSDTTYTMRFQQDQLSWEPVSGGSDIFRVMFELEEV
jgi:hypothetical protein